MDSKSVSVNTHDNARIENGERLSKMPMATSEQLHIAKILSQPVNDAELKQSVVQLQELTQCTEDEAVTALYDCENNIARAVDLLLDKLRGGLNSDWHTTSRKPRVKHTSTNDSVSHAGNHPKEDSRGNDRQKKIGSVNRNPNPKSVSAVGTDKSEPYNGFAKSKNIRSSKILVNANNLSEVADVQPKDNYAKPITHNSIKDQRPNTRCFGNWDPYTEYGDWGGEAIEVINSNASLAHGLQTESAPSDELFVDTDIKPAEELHCSDASTEMFSPKSVAQCDGESLFVSKATSKPPPPAFKELPDVPVFIVPEILPKFTSNLSFKFGGDPCIPYINAMSSSKQNPVHSSVTQTNTQTAPLRSDLESQLFSSTHDAPSFDISKSNPSNSRIDENTGDSQSQGYAPHFQSVNFTSKPNVFSSAAQTPTYTSDRSGFLEPSLKNYLLDNLPSEISKMPVTNTSVQRDTPVQFVPSSSQSQSINSTFPHSQANSGASIQQMGKVSLAIVSGHDSLHNSQAPATVSSHQSPATALPPGMAHFISQFTPAPYHMFNLAGNSGSTQAMLEQLFHQHRMYYDLHLHQQAATTAQSLLPSNSETPSTNKSHAIPGSMNHATAANPTIRPDILAPAMGHPPQLLPTGHPFFSYPGFVLMNGIPNAFMNQQSATDGQAQGPNHAGSSMPQTLSQSSVPQSYATMKPVNTSGMAYEEYFDMKYGDPTKQVGYKTGSQQSGNFGAFQGHMASVDGVGSKLPTTTGILNPGFNVNSVVGSNAPPFLPQFYSAGGSPSPFLNATVAATQQQQLPSGGSSANQSNVGVTVGQGGGNHGAHGQMHMGNTHQQNLVMGSSGPGALHHAHHHSAQRSVISHQH